MPSYKDKKAVYLTVHQDSAQYSRAYHLEGVLALQTRDIGSLAVPGALLAQHYSHLDESAKSDYHML
jgi:hypothetical protein